MERTSPSTEPRVNATGRNETSETSGSSHEKDPGKQKPTVDKLRTSSRRRIIRITHTEIVEDHAPHQEETESNTNNPHEEIFGPEKSHPEKPADVSGSTNGVPKAKPENPEHTHRPIFRERFRNYRNRMEELELMHTLIILRRLIHRLTMQMMENLHRMRELRTPGRYRFSHERYSWSSSKERNAPRGPSRVTQPKPTSSAERMGVNV